MGYKISVIIPVYNVEEYVTDAILSIMNQTIGFENIQMILVNDGSTDNSPLICEKYAMEHDNILYISQENSGVSAARNCGLQHATGEYITFLDADDKWQTDAFEMVCDFFQEHKDVIDVVACELEFFGAKTGISHPLNFKFTEDKIVDVQYDYDYVQMSMASCVIKRTAILEKFNENLKYAEDALFINKIILETCKYGIMQSVHYMYRKRFDETSAIDNGVRKATYYNDTLQGFHYEMINHSVEKFGEVIPYVQSVVMYDLQWRINKAIPQNILTKAEEEAYKNSLTDIIKKIEDPIIVGQKNLGGDYKMLALSIKNATDITKCLTERKGIFYFNNLSVFSPKNKACIRVVQIYETKTTICVEGLIGTPISTDDYIVFAEVNGNLKKINHTDYIKNEKVSYLGHYYYDRYFRLNISKKEVESGKVKFKFQYKNGYLNDVDLGRTNISNFNNVAGVYINLGSYQVMYENCTLVIKKNQRKLYLKNEIKFLGQLLKKNLWKIALGRLIVLFIKPLHKKEIWLISDRWDAAGDNGEALFKYISTLKECDITPYFVLSKKSADYKRIRKYGKVLEPNTGIYKIMFLLSDKIISSHAGDNVINPFYGRRKYVCDLFRFDFVFLQHGITKDDLSAWLHKANKNISLFVTAAYWEYESIVKGDYYYDETVVKQIGFPRHDYLENAPEKKIFIMPTWRKEIDVNENHNGENAITPYFTETEFFKRYHSLIYNEKLLTVMKEKGYRGFLCLHPRFKEQSQYFEGNEVFTILKNVNYNQAFKEGSLLVTDFSSTSFDFAYLNKPVIYYQFDSDEFFCTHTYEKGYFSYEEHGFGPVCKEEADIVEKIIQYINNDCELSDFYRKRIDGFYQNRDRKNCERVYAAIKEINKIQ